MHSDPVVEKMLQDLKKPRDVRRDVATRMVLTMRKWASKKQAEVVELKKKYVSSVAMLEKITPKGVEGRVLVWA